MPFGVYFKDVDRAVPHERVETPETVLETNYGSEPMSGDSAALGVVFGVESESANMTQPFLKYWRHFHHSSTRHTAKSVSVELHISSFAKLRFWSFRMDVHAETMTAESKAIPVLNA
jgi:hypothetical protein